MQFWRATLASGARLRIKQSIRAQTRKTYASAIRTWASFCRALKLRSFPACVDDLALFASLFRNGGTARVYIAGVRKAHSLLGQPWPAPWQMMSVNDVCKGVDNVFPRCSKRPAIGVDLLKQIVQRASQNALYSNRVLDRRSWLEFAGTAVLAFAFLARVQSELLSLHPRQVLVTGNSVTLKDVRRKNEKSGVSMSRDCLCTKNGSQNRGVCPVHWAQRLAQMAQSDRFVNLSLSKFNQMLRACLRDLNVPRAQMFSSHAFRRGCAQSLVKGGSPLAQVLRAGGWRSNAFWVYLDEDAMNRTRLTELVTTVSSDED